MIFVFSLLSSVLTDTDPSWKLFYDLAERGRYGTVLIAIDPEVILPFPDFLGSLWLIGIRLGVLSLFGDYLALLHGPFQSDLDEIRLRHLQCSCGLLHLGDQGFVKC